MDMLRSKKDRSYRNVFKGSVLVSTLMDHDQNRFATRAHAVKFAQKLLDAGHIESIVASSSFEDSVHLYRWADETVVREAKRMVSTNSSHIPKKRLIEMIDMGQGQGNPDSTSVKDMKDRLAASKISTDEKSERRERRERRRERRRKTLDSSTQPSEDRDPLSDTINHKSRDIDSDLIRTNSASSTGNDFGDETISRVASPPRVLSDKESETSPRKLTAPAKFQPIHPLRESRVRSPDTLRDSRMISPETTTSETTRESRLRSPDSIENQISFSPSVRSPISSRSQSRESGLCSPERPPSHPPSSPSSSRPLTPERSTRVRSRSTERAGSRPLSPASSRALSPDNINQSNNHSTRVRSPESRANRRPSDANRDIINVDDNNNEDPEQSTCRYDGVDMPALDLENYSGGIPEAVSNSLSAISQSLDDLVGQSGSYSDNEKQLLEQMKKMRNEHQSTITTYEDKINELLSQIGDLRTQSERRLLESGGFQGADISLVLADRGLGGESSTDGWASPPPAPPIPAAPPPPPTFGLLSQKTVQPTKPVIKPRVKMRPLFWNRIVLDHEEDNSEKEERERARTFWHSATEPNFDVDEFETMFGKSAEKDTSRLKSLHDAIGNQVKGRFQAAKILNEHRSRAVAIRLRSMHCGMEDITHACYQMDFSKIDLESLWGLYEIRGRKDELEKIETHLQAHEDVPLDQPEQFLVELSQMSHFPERMECMMLRKRFNETLFNIDQQLINLQTAIDELKSSESLKNVMEMVLSFGNYMNGGTQRGQADGYDLTILAKLRDVKTMDNNSNLLQYLVKVYTREHEDDAGRNEATFRLPDPTLMFQAAQTSFIELDQELTQLQHQLNTHSKKAEIVYLDTEQEFLNPFKERMDDFFESAEEMLKRQQKKLEETQNGFIGFSRFLAVKDKTEQMNPETFFTIWASFFDHYRSYWKQEQSRIAKESFQKVQQRKKDRIRHAKRRKSVVEDGKANLKARFAERRRRSENVAHTVRQFRTQTSLCNDSDTDFMSDAGMTTDASEVPTRVTPPTALTHVTGEERPRRRRTRPPRVELPDFTSGHESDTTNGNLTDSSVQQLERRGRESMAERMQRRRKSQVSIEEIQTNLNKIESMRQRSRDEGEVQGREDHRERRRPSRSEMPDMVPSVTTTDRLHRRRRPQPVTMEADAEAVFPAPQENATRQPQEGVKSQEAMTSHRRRRPMRADHETNMEVMYNQHNGAAVEQPLEGRYRRTRSSSRDGTTGNGYGEVTRVRQRTPRQDIANVQHQHHQNIHPQNGAQAPPINSNNAGVNSAFLKNRTRFSKHNHFVQDDGGQVNAHQMPLQRSSRSHSQPAVHHLHNMSNGELQQANRYNDPRSGFQQHRLRPSASSDLDQPREDLQVNSSNFRDVLRKMSRPQTVDKYSDPSAGGARRLPETPQRMRSRSRDAYR